MEYLQFAFSLLFIIPVLALISAYIIEEMSAILFTFIALVGLAVYYIFFTPPFNIFVYAWYNPLHVLAFIGLYLLSGLLYSFFKWWRFLLSEKKKWSYTWEGVNAEKRKEAIERYMPSVSNHLDSIAVWIVYWPFSLLWTLLSDILNRVIVNIWNGIKNLATSVRTVYEKITEYVWSKI